VESVWLKSDLMPTRTWVVEMEDGLFERLLDRIEGAGMPGEPPVDDGMAPYCSLDVRVGDARWGDGGPCADLPAEFAPLWNDVTVMLHPQWFAARHLLEAGRDAESKMDAGDVFHYYDDGLGVLGADYGIAESETGKQIVEARESQAAGEHVDAVVLARNALASRLAFYRKERLVGLAVSDPDGSR